MGLNPFEFRASFGLLGGRGQPRAAGLNPFEFRASFGQRPRFWHLQTVCVLIPLNSGLHLDLRLLVHRAGGSGLNPFEFRASFGLWLRYSSL